MGAQHLVSRSDAREVSEGETNNGINRRDGTWSARTSEGDSVVSIGLLYLQVAYSIHSGDSDDFHAIPSFRTESAFVRIHDTRMIK